MAQESTTDLECRLTQAQRELSEARQQQVATSEILHVILADRRAAGVRDDRAKRGLPLR